MVIEGLGGYEKAIKTITAGMETIKKQGSLIKKATIGEPSKVIRDEKTLYSVVSEKIFMDHKGKSFYSISALLAVSPDEGKNWYFLDLGSMQNDRLKQLFPTVYDKLIIPERTGPIEIKE